MVTEDISELVVKITPEGMQETNEQLDQTQENFEKTADGVEDTAGLMSGFAKKFKGAGLIFVGAFSTIVAAIASRMPILEETASGFGVVLTALGLQADKAARGPLTTFNETMFETGDAVADADGFLEGLLIAIGGIQLGQIRAIADAFSGVGDVITTLVDTHVPDLDTVIDDLATTFENSWDTIKSAVKGALSTVTTKLNNFIGGDGPVAGIVSALGKLTGEDGAFASVVDAVSGIVDDITSKFKGAKTTVINNFVNPLIEQINKVIKLANKIPNVDIETVDKVGTGQEGDQQDFFEEEFADSTGGGTPTRGGVGAGNTPLDPGGRPTGNTVTIKTDIETNLDSRTIAQETKDFTVTGVLSGGRGARLR